MLKHTNINKDLTKYQFPFWRHGYTYKLEYNRKTWSQLIAWNVMVDIKNKQEGWQGFFSWCPIVDFLFDETIAEKYSPQKKKKKSKTTKIIKTNKRQQHEHKKTNSGVSIKKQQNFYVVFGRCSLIKHQLSFTD